MSTESPPYEAALEVIKKAESLYGQITVDAQARSERIKALSASPDTFLTKPFGHLSQLTEVVVTPHSGIAEEDEKQAKLLDSLLVSVPASFEAALGDLEKVTKETGGLAADVTEVVGDLWKIEKKLKEARVRLDAEIEMIKAHRAAEIEKGKEALSLYLSCKGEQWALGMSAMHHYDKVQGSPYIMEKLKSWKEIESLAGKTDAAKKDVDQSWAALEMWGKRIKETQDTLDKLNATTGTVTLELAKEEQQEADCRRIVNNLNFIHHDLLQMHVILCKMYGKADAGLVLIFKPMFGSKIAAIILLAPTAVDSGLLAQMEGMVEKFEKLPDTSLVRKQLGGTLEEVRKKIDSSKALLKA